VILSSIFLLAGCTSPIENVGSNAVTGIPIFTFEKHISDHMPAFKFEVYEGEWDGHDFPQIIYTIEISCPEFDFAPQSIKVSSFDKWDENRHGRNHYIDLVDITFDGYSDIQALMHMATANTTYLYYRWNVSKRAFEEEYFFSMITKGYELYPELKQITNYVNGNSSSYSREVYQLEEIKNGHSEEYKKISDENLLKNAG